MKKLWIVIAVIAVALAGVIIGNQQRKSAMKTEQDGKVVVVINGGPKETDTVAVERQKTNIARFNKEYPNIEIRWTDRPYSPDSFATSMAGGTAEDVIGLWATEGYVAERGYALDLTEMINKWKYKDQVNHDVLKLFIRNGKIYGLPTDGYLMGLLYNKALFKKAGLVDADGNPDPPDTWEEFVRCARKLTNKKAGIAGFGIMGNGAEAGWGVLNWVWQAGGEFEQEVDGKWKAVFDSPEAAAAYTFVQNLKWKHDVLQSNLMLTSQDLQARFSAGQIGMLMAAQDRVTQLINQYGMKLSDIGVAILPAGPAGRANQMGGFFNIINPNSSPQVQEAAFKWITWNLLRSVKPETIREKADDLRKQKQIGNLTALPLFTGELDRVMRQTAKENSDVLIDYHEVWQEAVKYLHPEPSFFCQQLYSEYLGPALQEVLTNRNAEAGGLLRKAAKGFQERFLNMM
jgi:ABC-type glycerol-3-phosphate transport system substrate-binding protein